MSTVRKALLKQQQQGEPNTFTDEGMNGSFLERLSNRSTNNVGNRESTSDIKPKKLAVKPSPKPAMKASQDIKDKTDDSATQWEKSIFTGNRPYPHPVYGHRQVELNTVAPKLSRSELYRKNNSDQLTVQETARTRSRDLRREEQIRDRRTVQKSEPFASVRYHRTLINRAQQDGLSDTSKIDNPIEFVNDKDPSDSNEIVPKLRGKSRLMAEVAALIPNDAIKERSDTLSENEKQNKTGSSSSSFSGSQSSRFLKLIKPSFDDKGIEFSDRVIAENEMVPMFNPRTDGRKERQEQFKREYEARKKQEKAKNQEILQRAKEASPVKV